MEPAIIIVISILSLMGLVLLAILLVSFYDKVKTGKSVLTTK